MPKLGLKLVVLDAGGVLHPDAEFGAPHQSELAALSGLSNDALNTYQNYQALNNGEQSLNELLSALANASELKPSIAQLLQAYKNGIALYPGAVELIRALYHEGYQVVICTNNSDLGVTHTRELLANADLSTVKVYGSAEMKMTKPDIRMFMSICDAEKVKPEECLLIDDRETNCESAKSLGMSSMQVVDPFKSYDQLTIMGIINNQVTLAPHARKGKYPSLFGIVDGNVVRLDASKGTYEIMDAPNQDGNQRKHCLYESLLSQFILEQGRKEWEPGYHVINQLFLADFDLRCDPSRLDDNKTYFAKIESTLKKDKLIADKENTLEELRAALINLFAGKFDLTNVSQFYYNVWLFDYGHQPLEPFVFLTDLLKAKFTVTNPESIRLLSRFTDMANSEEDRAKAYPTAQPWLTCGTPQLRGRQQRQDAPKPANSNTFGILRDDDVYASTLTAPPHFAAKTLFSPQRKHAIAQELQAIAAPIIGGSSGTLGRNVYMLAPLVQTGLLSKDNLMRYVMGFSADLVYRGHHSFEEIAFVANEVLFRLDPSLDPLRDPIKYYEQLLTPAFLKSTTYNAFIRQYSDFFNTPFERKSTSYPGI